MTFADSVKTVFSKYATFTGRATRSEYWYFVLFNAIATIVLSTVDLALGMNLLSGVYSLAVLIPGIAVGVRRLHDMGKAGTMLLLCFVPIVGLIVIYWMCQPSVEDNQYGPKQA